MRKQFVVLFIAVIFLVGASTVFSAPKRQKRSKRHKVVLVPDSPRPVDLEPIHEDRIQQNKIADKLGIPVLWDDQVFKQLKLSQNKRTDTRFTTTKYQLVPSLHSKHLSAKASYTYPWINVFLENFGQQEQLATNRKIEINSFMRTLQRQRSMITPCLRYVKIRRGRHKGEMRCVRNRAYNPHAAHFDDSHPELISLHVRALAFDISRKNLNLRQIEWIRAKLIELKKKDIGVFPIEEQKEGSSIYRINCFHVVVFDPLDYQVLIKPTTPVIIPPAAP